jgi:hypothetical protein
MESCFVLLERNTNKLFGVFTDKVLLYSMIENIIDLAPSKMLTIKEIVINTNVTKNTYDSQSIKELLPFNTKTFSSDTNIPIDIKFEVDKIKNKFNIFKENFKVFKKLLEDKVITLEDDIEKVPELFKDKYEIYRDIEVLKVPEKEQFQYFIDRYE